VARSDGARSKQGRSTTLNASQELIWLRQRLASGEPLFDSPCTFDIHGELDEAAFVRAFARLVELTDAMRFVMRARGGEPDAVVLDEGPRGCELVDLSEQPDKLEEWVRDRMQHAPDPEHCLYDAALVKLASVRYCWFLSTHHLITDGWNLMLLFRRQEACYRAELDHGTVGPFPQLLDSIESEHDYRRSPAFTKHALWWKARAARVHAGSKFYEARMSDPSPHQVRVPVSLGRERTHKLRNVAGAPPFQGLNADLGLFHAFVVALLAWQWRLSRHDTLAIGVTSHGRAKSVQRETAGLFMQQLPFQVEVTANDDFAALARRVARSALEFFAHAVPGSASPEAQKSFDVTFNYIHGSFGRFDSHPCEMEWRHNGFGDPERRLGVTVHDFNATGVLELLLDFNEAAFGPSARARTIRHLLATLDAMVTDPGTPLTNYPLLGDGEREAILHRLDSGESPRQSHDSLWSAFLAVSARVPERHAVEGLNASLSYSELAREATDAAGLLRERGVGDGDVVALVSSRRVEAIPALLGILAAGAAFMPLDPALPEERRRWLLRDSDAKVSVEVTDHGVRIDAVAGGGSAAYGDGATPAYLLYTSGSTGTPNGVLVGHASVINLLEACESLRSMPPDGRCSWWTNVGFDVAVYEIFSALLYGRTLVVPDERTRLSPEALFEWLASEKITGAYLPPFYLPNLDRWLDDNAGPPLSRLLVGVESIPQRRLASIGSKLGGLAIINGYGPTEATVCPTLHLVDLDDQGPGPTPIGKPVPGTRCYLLDRNGKPTPEGVVSELYIGGSALAIGYHRREALTRERFAVDPLGLSEDKFFRTGDGVRLRDDGALQFCGRLDQQLKLQGERIEPAEVRHVVLDYPGIVECHVTATDSGRVAGDERLAAYYVPENGVDERALKAHARRRLPIAMVPAAFCALGSIPRNANGKPDESALPSPQWGPEPGAETSGPRSDAEARISAIWREELAVERIDVHDMFIDVGGNSLLAARIVARVNEAFGVQLAFADVFETESVAELAKLVEETLLEEIERMDDMRQPSAPPKHD